MSRDMSKTRKGTSVGVSPLTTRSERPQEDTATDVFRFPWSFVLSSYVVVSFVRFFAFDTLFGRHNLTALNIMARFLSPSTAFSLSTKNSLLRESMAFGVAVVVMWILDSYWNTLCSRYPVVNSIQMVMSGYMPSFPVNRDLICRVFSLPWLERRSWYSKRKQEPISWQLSDAALLESLRNRGSCRRIRTANMSTSGCIGRRHLARGERRHKSGFFISISVGTAEIRAGFGGCKLFKRERRNSGGETIDESHGQQKDKKSHKLKRIQNCGSKYKSNHTTLPAGKAKLSVSIDAILDLLGKFVSVVALLEPIYRLAKHSTSRWYDGYTTSSVANRTLGTLSLQGLLGFISPQSAAETCFLRCFRIQALIDILHSIVPGSSFNEKKINPYYNNCHKDEGPCHGKRKSVLNENLNLEDNLVFMDKPVSHKKEGSILDSIGMDFGCPDVVKHYIPDEFLLQLGSLIGEPVSLTAAKGLGKSSIFDSSKNLLGLQEDACKVAWSPVVHEANESLELQAWRIPLRKGLYAYMVKTVLYGVSPAAAKAFQLNDSVRKMWDPTAISIERIVPSTLQDGNPSTEIDDMFHQGISDKNFSECSPVESTENRSNDSCIHRYISRFPRPMTAREYKYVRRVWHRPSDGGCYFICRNCTLPDYCAVENYIGQVKPNKTVEVNEYWSCMAIKATDSLSLNNTEMVSIYFEDSLVRPSLAKMAVPKGLWPYWKNYADSLKDFVKDMELEYSSDSSCYCYDDSHNRSCSDDGFSEDGSSSTDMASGKNGLLSVYLDSHPQKDVEHTLRATSSSHKWARSILIAGALRMAHLIFMAS